VAAAGDAGRVPRNVADATHDLYRQYGKQIYAYCLHQLRSREEAEDAVQTTFLNAFRGLQHGTTTRFEQAWLYKIAQNVCIARRSSSGRRLRLEAPDDFEILQEVVSSADATNDGDTLELMGLEDALDSMPENQRRAILLREWQGLSYREIAAELGLSQGAVEMLIFRARRTLALALERPDVADKRRLGKTKVGFRFGSLVAAMKPLFSTGAALKMAAITVSAAVVGTNTVHSVVQHAMSPRPTRSAARAVPHEVVPETAAAVPVVMKVRAALLSHRASHARVAAAGKLAAGSPPQSGPGQVPVVATDAAPSPPPPTPAPTDAPPPPAPVTSSGSSIAPTAAPVTPPTSSSAPPSRTPNPPSARDSSSEGSQGPRGSTGGGHHVEHGTRNVDLNGNGSEKAGVMHRHDDGPDQPATTTATQTDTTTIAPDTTTTSEPVESSTDTTTTATTQSTTDATPTTTSMSTTTTSGDGGSSSSGSSDSHHGNDHGGGDGGGSHGGGGGRGGHGHEG
jgi:RNA polymerase sigma-70 factor (ECF subfamily)